MPTISTDSIEGFAEMTAEQKVDALLKLEVPEKVDLSGFIPKAQFDKTASELAEAKKAIKSRMTEEEASAAEREAKWAEMEAKLAKLEQEKLESSYKANYLSLGYDESLAEETAKAMASGNIAKVFENQRKAADLSEKKLKAELMKGTPHPEGAGGDDKYKEPKNIEQARNLGKSKAESRKDSRDVLKHYM